jgi:RNA polymerase sigma-70 factor (ECF subfamily)
MLIETLSQSKTGAPTAIAASRAPKALKKRNVQGEYAKEVSVTAAKKPNRMAWVTHLNAIRDKQDQAAFAEVFAHFAPRVKAFLMKSGASPDLAEDVTQEVMATLWRKAHMFDPTKASVSTWIFTIARNRRIDVLRKQRRPEPEDLTWGPEAEPDQADVLALQQESAQLGEAIAALPDKQRELIVRAYYGELTHSEIADATGLPLGTIKSRIRLALDRLRHQLK